MRIIKNLAQHKLVVLMVVVLLCVQAACDLALPNYTSDIVDTGIQQQGVQDVAAEQLTGRTHDLVAMMLPEPEEQMFADAYAQNEDGTYSLTESGKRDRAALDDAMALPMTVTCYADQIAELDLDQVKAAYDQGMIGKDDIQAMLDRARGSMGDMADTLIAQQGLAAARAEYEQLGYDLDAMQMDYLAATGAKMLGLAALGMVIAVMVGFLASRTAAKVGRSLRERLFNQVVGFSDAEIQSFSAASLITRGTNDVQLVQMVTVMLLRMVLYAPILAIGGIIMIARTDLSMGWIIIAAVAAIAVIMGVLMKVAMPKFKIMQKLIDRVNLVSRELLTGLPVIRAFGREQHEEARFDEANTRLMKTQLFTNRVMTFMMPLMMLIMNLVSVGIIWFGGHAIDAGNLQTGDLIAFITYSMVIIMGFLMIGMLSIMLPRADVAAQRIDEVLECKPSIADPDPGKAKDALLGANGLPGARIAFENVSFRYSDGAECVLEDVSFTCEPGKTTAIIGSTGSGKSTVLKLAERFHDVTSGRITVDGVDVRDVSQHALRAQLGYVPQAAFLFSGTIASNVGYGVDDADENRIRAAADVAQASEFIAERPEGLATPISQGGTNVSGGQRQRLAIARALATDARAYLFDDSFSALDYKTDAALRHELSSRLGGKTVVIVAQRISTVLNADQIVVLDDGRVVGAGTHEQLMESCQEYREIAMSQLSEEELKGGDAR
ncbi:MAG: ABC transporter ATP-binding protein [Senegalimassilia anaerobia]|uniref:ABC transporter ATP-binding protein n=1 Tax=Senegalimassilia anaerobia TaxID=1473216 RepID=UPI002E768E40|nr:ABC transporter ATP-binding protein [Senegalimassilia anaerobia]MEE0302759.1 ABC transporter ATP-binding protein [Senegalimassilia anaerobia]